MITANGHTATRLTDLKANDLSGIDVLVVQVPSTYTSEYTTNMSNIQAAVSNGMVLMVHDRAVSSAETILPGSSGFSFTASGGTDLNIDSTQTTSEMAEGPAGRLSDTSLDGGSSSHHGYIASNLLPNGATALLDTGTATNISTFSYAYGDGAVIYSTIPLDYYLATGNTPTAFDTVYAPNIVQYAASLALEGHQTLAGTSTGETVAGTAGPNIIQAGGGNDTVYGLAGADTLNGEAGDDTLMGGTGDDILNGGDGTDTATYAHAGSAVTVSLATGTATGGDGNDTLTNIENLTGSAHADTLTGDSGANTLTGGEGSDTFAYTATSLNSGDLTTGDTDTTDAAAGDIINFTAGAEALLKSGGTLLSALGANTALGSVLDANNSIALVDAGSGNMQIHIDNDGGLAADVIIDIADTVTSATYDSTNDYITLA